MKENSFAQYISKQKIKGNYTSELDEGKIGDFFKKDWYNTKKHLSGNLKDDEIELYRITGDFSDKSFREAIISKCIDAVQKKAKEEAEKTESETGDKTLGTKKLKEILEEIEPEKVQELALPTIQETVKNIINRIVGLAKGINSGYAENDDEQEKNDNLYAGGIKGYKYSWVQKDKLYIYFDSEKAARDFLREHLREQKHLEIDENVISKMFSIEKCIRNKGKVYDKVKTEERHYDKNSPIEHTEFDKECSKIIFDKIKDELIKNAENARYGKKVPVGRITWSWSDDEIKDFLTQCVKSGVKDVDGIKSKIEEVFKSVTDAAEESGHFLYAKGTAKGNVNLNFERLSDAEDFKVEFENSADYGTLSAAADGKANSKFIAKAKSGDKQIKAAKLMAKIVKMAAENFDQIKVTEEEAAEAEAKLNAAGGKKVETYTVTWTLTNSAQEERVNAILRNHENDEARKLSSMLTSELNHVNETARHNDVIYAEYTANGDIILHFAQEYQAKEFINDMNKSDKQFGTFSNIKRGEVVEAQIKKFTDNASAIMNNNAEKLTNLIIQKQQDKINSDKTAKQAEEVNLLTVTANVKAFEKSAKKNSKNLEALFSESVISAFNRVFTPIKLSLINETEGEDASSTMDIKQIIAKALAYIKNTVEHCAVYKKLESTLNTNTIKLAGNIKDNTFILKTAGVNINALENLKSELERELQSNDRIDYFTIQITTANERVSDFGAAEKKKTATAASAEKPKAEEIKAIAAKAKPKASTVKTATVKKK